MNRKRRVTSAQHIRDIAITQLKKHYLAKNVYILSVSSDGQLLVGRLFDVQLHVYSTDGGYVASIDVPGGDRLRNAVWTPRGNIVYTTTSSNKVVVVSRSGDVIARKKMTDPSRISVSLDDVIYLADGKNGVYQSIDDGVTWSQVFKSPDKARCIQVITVSTSNYTDDMWTIEFSGWRYRLRVYTVDRRLVNNGVTWHDVTFGNVAYLEINSRLAFDGNSNMFLLRQRPLSKCTEVHVFSVSGQYERRLLSEQQFSDSISADLAVHNQLMYVATDANVGVYALTYESA